MFNKLAAAVIAVSLIAGPALAQGTTAPPASTSQPAANADSSKSGIKATTTASVKHAGKTHKHAAKAVKHRKHVAHAKHGKATKHVKRHAKSKTFG
jgi:hypothetical protein